MARDRRSVLFLPAWCEVNPYQPLLAKTLGEEGYAVDFADYPKARLPLFRLLLNRRRVGVLHIHWIAPWMRPLLWSGNPVKRLIKLLLLILDLRLCRLLGVPIYWTIHNLVSHESADPQWELRLRRQIARLVDGCFVHSQSALALLEREYGVALAGKTQVVPHASYVGQYPAAPPDAVTTMRYDLGLKASDFVYLFVGAIRRYKGVGELVEAFRALPDDDARLVIAGAAFTPDIEDWLRAAVAEDRRIVLRIGYVPDEDLPSYLNLASVVVLPYARTLASGSALLAMSFAKPLILPEAARVFDVPGDNGALYFKPGQLPDALMGARRADLTRMAAANRAEAETRTWPAMAAITAAAYRARDDSTNPARTGLGHAGEQHPQSGRI